MVTMKSYPLRKDKFYPIEVTEPEGTKTCYEGSDDSHTNRLHCGKDIQYDSHTERSLGEKEIQFHEKIEEMYNKDK